MTREQDSDFRRALAAADVAGPLFLVLPGWEGCHAAGVGVAVFGDEAAREPAVGVVAVVVGDHEAAHSWLLVGGCWMAGLDLAEDGLGLRVWFGAGGVSECLWFGFGIEQAGTK